MYVQVLYLQVENYIHPDFVSQEYVWVYMTLHKHSSALLAHQTVIRYAKEIQRKEKQEQVYSYWFYYTISKWKANNIT